MEPAKKIPVLEEGSVHFAKKERLQDKIDSYRTECEKMEIAFMEGDISEISDEMGLFDVLEEVMQFPYFGRNWDALNDCIRDLEWLSAKGYLLILHGSENFLESNKLLEVELKLIHCWMFCSDFWKEKEVPFHLVLEFAER